MEEANRSITHRISNLLESGGASLHIPGLDDEIVDVPFRQGQGQQRGKPAGSNTARNRQTDRENITIELSGTQQSHGGHSHRLAAASLDHHPERLSNAEIKRNVSSSKVANTESWVEDDFSQN